MQKNRILYIVESFGGGVYIMVKTLAENMCERYDVTIAYALRPQTPPNFEKEIDHRIHLIPLKYAVRKIYPWKDIQACLEIKRIVKNVNPDIVHLHSSKAGVLGRISINSRNVPVLYTPHGYAFLKEDDGKLKRRIYREIEKLMARKGGITVGCSKAEYQFAREITSRCTYVENGINIKILPKCHRQKTDIRNLKIAMSGRITEQKAPESFNRVAESVPEFEFCWIGDGEMRKSLTAKNITVTGWKEAEEAWEILNDHDVFLLLSLWEGLSVSLLEAMYMEKICIVRDLPSSREVIRDKVNGFIVKTEEDAIRILKEIRDGKYDIEHIKRKARRDIELNFTEESMCRNYDLLYRKILRIP